MREDSRLFILTGLTLTRFRISHTTVKFRCRQITACQHELSERNTPSTQAMQSPESLLTLGAEVFYRAVGVLPFVVVPSL